MGKDIKEVEAVEVANSIEKELLPSLQGRKPTCTIYHVSKLLREASKSSFKPQLASIGPFHHGKEALRPMEVQKFRHVKAILSRNPEMNLKNYVKAIMRLETRARKCYSESINMEANEFVKMMVVDGCFLLEIFLGIRNIKPEDELWMLHFIASDMLLLENQLPFFVLQCIYHLVLHQEDPGSMTELVLECFKFVLPLNGASKSKECYNHLLDLFHHHCLPAPASSLFFSFKLQSIFHNVIAYEQCNPAAGTFFTGYALFMDNIINTSKDVQILRHSRILEHGLGSDDELAQHFNQLGIGVFLRDQTTHLYLQRMQIDQYCKIRRHVWRGNLMRDYFYRPWAGLAFAALLIQNVVLRPFE